MQTLLKKQMHGTQWHKMGNFGNTNELNVRSAYEKTFFGVADGTVYADPAGTQLKSHSFSLESAHKIDMRQEWSDRIDENLAQLKSMGTDVGGTGLTDNVLIPIAYRNELIDLTRKQTPISFVIRSVSNQGIVAPFKQVTAKPTSFFARENATLLSSDPDFDVIARHLHIVSLHRCDGRRRFRLTCPYVETRAMKGALHLKFAELPLTQRRLRVRTGIANRVEFSVHIEKRNPLSLNLNRLPLARFKFRDARDLDEFPHS